MQNEIPEPWNSFLVDVDRCLEKKTSLTCIGGFIIAMLYDFERETSDLDFIDCVPNENIENLMKIGGNGSDLHNKHKVFLDHVTVAQTTYSYEDRLEEIFEGKFQRLRIYTLDPYDLALTKLERNLQRDREDLLRLVNSENFSLERFVDRYEKEFKIYVEDGRHRSTFKFWLDLIEDSRS